ncbi:choice-of-anchor I domain-containing protein [Cyanobium gracile]|uniref:choice-of-anchor I domain-containing protein n=1 Tax=Cyanobium gracile TaxID=59930 RepID=UPI003A4C774B
MALTFSALDPFIQATDGVISLGSLGANAEISAYNPASGYLYTVGGGSGAIVVSDLRDPANPQTVARATSTGNGETLQSAAVFGDLLAIAVQNAVKTDPGFVQFYDLSNPALPVHLSTVTVGALPDMVKFSSDGTKLLVTNEGEPNSLYTIDPVGSISLINTSGYLAATPLAPTAADLQSVGFEAWENRREELINRGVRIGTRLGVTTSVAQDIEPEAIAISADGNTAWISLQENNAIAVVDLSGSAPVITTIFSAGIKDWSRGVASAENFSYELEYAAGASNQPEGVLAGGLSGLFFAGKEAVNGTELDVYFSITDRGPNGDLIAGQRQFLDPDFQPTIYKLGMNRATGAVTELGRLGLNRPDGTPLTGLPQLAIKDDVPIDAANAPLAYDPFGIDSETVSRFSLSIGGSTREVFAVGDEYRGQIAIFDALSGNLIQRYIPAGQKAQLAAQHNVGGASPIGAETIDSLPAIYGNRWSNRGIEGMAFNPTDGLLYAFMQSPLDVDANGDGVTEGRSRSELTRILAIDPATGNPVKEHLYLLSGRTGQDKIGDVAFDAARGVFVVMERDSSRSLTGFKHVYEVDLRGATDTLPLTSAADQATDGWLGAIGVVSPELLDNRRTLVDHDSNAATAPIFSTSSADVLAAAGIRLAHKIELFNLPSIGGSLAFDKPEGLTIRDDGALVINYDNDFGTEGASGNTFTVVSFDGAGFDSSDRDVDGSSGGGNQYRPVSGLPLYSLTMPDGIATFTDPQGRSFLLAVGEGDSREYEPDQGNIFFDLTRASDGALVNGTPFRDHPGVDALNDAFAAATGVSRTRLNLLNDYGDINGDGLIDKPFSIGSRSLRIYDVQGNVVFDSSDALEELADSLGLMASNRDDDKGTEPEMVEIATVAGRTYAFVALERTTTSVAAVFDVTDPYNVAAVDPVVFPGAERIEGITFLRSAAGEPAGLIASSEGNDVVSITAAAPLPAGSAFKLQLFHLADQEGAISALDNAPRLSGVLNALRAQDIDLDGIPGFVNTLTLSSGDAWIPGLFYGASAQAYGAVGRGDVLIQNALGVQAIAFGNHEFDQGTAVVRDLVGPNAAAGYPGTAFPYLSGNLDFSTDANLASLVVPAGQAPQPNSITSSVVFDVNGESVGVVGATTPWLRTISSPGGVGVAPAPFSGVPTDAELDALAAEIQADVDALIAANPGLNKVILLAHMQQISIEQALAERLRHVDIIVAGGSNTRLFDSDDVARPGDSVQGPYPIVKTDADGKPVAVVNTDGTYKYLGRLVLDFDGQGVIIPESYDPTISGAFRTDADAVAALNAEAFIDARVQEVVDNLRAVIVSQESEWFGVSEVFLNGNRNPGVRSEETNFGNLTADANLAYARQIDSTVLVSLKNGGGIRNSIGQSVIPTGSVDGVPDLLPTAAVFDAQGNVVKPEGGISRNDIANALSFNNGLSLVSVTPGELKALIEHGIAAGVNQGRFPQVGGLAFSYDLSRPAGSRVVNLAIQDDAGNDLDVVVRNGSVVGDPTRSIRMVTLDFLASGGDGYPFASLTNPNRVNITEAGAPRTGVATFAANGSEQDALAEFLAANHSPANPFTAADTPAALDRRLQNLSVRGDSVIDPVITLTGGAVLENLPADTLVGELSAIDPDGSDTFSFSFAPNGNPGDLFRLDGDRLLTTAPLDFEAAATLGLTLRVTDGDGTRYDRPFTITVTDLAEGAAVQAAEINAPGFSITNGVGGNPQGSVPSGRPLATGSLGSVQTAPITLPGESEPRARIENTSYWNSLKNLTLGADYWNPSLGSDLLVANFVDVRWDLSTAPSLDFDLQVVGAKRGAIDFGGGDDTLTWLFHSDGAARSNTATVSGGEGNDVLRFAAVGSSDLDDVLLADNGRPAGNGSQWNATYDGRFSTAFANGGEGDDRIETEGNVRLQADGGEGDDILIGARRNDRLIGGLGEDTLIGGGDDGSFRYTGRGSGRRVVVSGGDLIDLQAPGGGGDGAADTVIYDLADGGVDRVRGFEAGLDRLQVIGGLGTAQVTEFGNGTFVSFSGRPLQGVLLEGVRGLSVGGAGDDIQLLA